MFPPVRSFRFFASHGDTGFLIPVLLLSFVSSVRR